MPKTEFVKLIDAAAIAGVSPDTITRRVRTGALPVHRSDRDRRVRLVAMVDLKRMTAIREGEAD